ncbi:MAG: DNA-3-methyladenine glycosylase [archaeon]|nr:DNA-3-methyladenine glycosylase [archaeon]
MEKLNKEFFARDSREVGFDLVGKLLVRNYNGMQLSGVISQVDAYSMIEAKEGKKNQGAFYAPSMIHMFPCQGKYMLAISTLARGVYNEILIRKVIPYEGIETMKKLRGNNLESALTDGPGKIVQAFGLDVSFDGKSLVDEQTNLGIVGHLKGTRVSKKSGAISSKDFVGRFELV